MESCQVRGGSYLDLGEGFFVWFFLGLGHLGFGIFFFLNAEANYKIPLRKKICLTWQGKPRRPTILIWIKIQTIIVTTGRRDYRYKLS